MRDALFRHQHNAQATCLEVRSVRWHAVRYWLQQDTIVLAGLHPFFCKSMTASPLVYLAIEVQYCDIMSVSLQHRPRLIKSALHARS